MKRALTTIIARAEFDRDLTRAEGDHVRRAMEMAGYRALARMDELAAITRRSQVVDREAER